MKLKMKLMAAALALAASAGAHAAITTGSNGDGELFFSIWDANGSYTRSLETSISSFESQLGATGNLALSWTADTTFSSFLAGTAGGTRSGAPLKWNILANDTMGANRVLTTYTAPEPTTTKTNDVMRTASAKVTDFLNAVNPVLVGDSVAVDSGSSAWAGKAAFKDTIGGYLNFSNAGTLANNSYENGLGFMRINAAATGTLPSVYNEYLEGTTAVNAYLDASNTLHIAAIPEPSEYALMLAGLGMLGFMARRRLNNRA